MIRKILGAAVGGVVLYGLGKALATRKRAWSVGRSRSGYLLHLTESPGWAVLLEDALDAFPCTCRLPGWTYKVGLRRFGTHDDETNDPIHSLGSAGFQLCNLRHNALWHFEKDIHKLPLTEEAARLIHPEWVKSCEAIFDEDILDDTPAP